MNNVIENIIVFYDETKWAAVPANNGTNGPYWQWANELLIGFTMGKYKKTGRYKN